MNKVLIVLFVLFAAGLGSFFLLGGLEKNPVTDMKLLAALSAATISACIIIADLLSRLFKKLVRLFNPANIIACLPIIAAPYAYILLIVILVDRVLNTVIPFDVTKLRFETEDIEMLLEWFSTLPERVYEAGNQAFWITWAFLAIFISLLLFSMFCAFRIKSEDMAPHKAAGMNIFIKVIHIPAHIVNIALGIVGALASMFWTGTLEAVLLLDIFTTALSGLYVVSILLHMRQTQKIGKGAAVWLGILSFIGIIDLIMSIVIFVIAFCRRKQVPVASDGLPVSEQPEGLPGPVADTADTLPETAADSEPQTGETSDTTEIN